MNKNKGFEAIVKLNGTMTRDFGVNYPKSNEFTARVSFRELRCDLCDDPPDRRHIIFHEFRDTVPEDETLPLLIGAYGRVSPRKASDWEVPENTPCIILPHYYRKEDGWTFFLCPPETKVRIRETPRYSSNPPLLPYNGEKGVIFSQEAELSTVIWIEGTLLPFDPPYVRHWCHRRCRSKGTGITVGAITVLR